MLEQIEKKFFMIHFIMDGYIQYFKVLSTAFVLEFVEAIKEIYGDT
jgi:hypothetical protein